MKIGTNPIGNYTPVRVTPKPAAIAEINKSKLQTENTINPKEKEFFSKLYPDQEKNIMDHHFYMKNGNMSGIMVGSLFDRRG